MIGHFTMNWSHQSNVCLSTLTEDWSIFSDQGFEWGSAGGILSGSALYWICSVYCSLQSATGNEATDGKSGHRDAASTARLLHYGMSINPGAIGKEQCPDTVTQSRTAPSHSPSSLSLPALCLSSPYQFQIVLDRTFYQNQYLTRFFCSQNNKMYMYSKVSFPQWFVIQLYFRMAKFN